MDPKEIRKMLVEKKILKSGEEDRKKDKEINKEEIYCENSIYLFNRHNPVRKYIYFIQKHKYFENFIMLLIALSSIKLAMESYLVDYPEDS